MASPTTATARWIGPPPAWPSGRQEGDGYDGDGALVTQTVGTTTATYAQDLASDESQVLVAQTQGVSDDVMRRAGERLPFGRHQTPQDAAYAVVYLLSDESVQVTGAVLNIDAGESMLPLKPDREQAWQDFAGWRITYDAVLLALALLTMAPEAPWSSDRAFPQQRTVATRLMRPGKHKHKKMRRA